MFKSSKLKNCHKDLVWFIALSLLKAASTSINLSTYLVAEIVEITFVIFRFSDIQKETTSLLVVSKKKQPGTTVK